MEETERKQLRNIRKAIHINIYIETIRLFANK
jgi:hypothetical protein